MTRFLSVFAIFFLFSTQTLAATALPVPAPPAIGAKSFLLQDYRSGKVLAEKDADETLEPASITKLMTAYVVFGALRSGTLSLSDKVRISEHAWRTPGSRMFVEVNSEVSVEDLVQGMIVQSGNDATVALAEQIGGTEGTFAMIMNQQAQDLGMTRSHFENSTGLPAPGHVSTARDIATLTRALIMQFPEYYKWYSQKEFTYNDIHQYNRNKLLWRDKSVDGVKTGHTDSAGYCLVASATRDDMRLISVVLGTANEKARADASQSLISYGFRFFESHKLYNKDTGLARARIWQGEPQQVAVGLVEDLYVAIPRGRYEQMKANMIINPRISAPIRKGEVLGTISIRIDEETIVESPLVALQAAAEGPLWQRLMDRALLYFE